MSAKPIDEFLQDCTVWLEKIAAAKQREEAAYAAIDNVQLEKKAFRALARGAGRFALGAGRLANASGRGLSRLGDKLLRAGAKPKPITLQNPLAKQVSVALKSGKPQPKLVRNAKGDYVLSQPTKAPALAAPASPATPAPGKPAPGKTADPTAKVEPPKGQTPQTKTTPADTKAPQQQTAPAEPAPGKPADPAAKVETPQVQGTQAAAGAEGAVAQPSLLRKAAPYALIGGAGFLAGRSTAPEPEYTSPAMVHNNMVYQQNQQAATPNIY